MKPQTDCSRCEVFKPYFGFFAGEAISLTVAPVIEPFMNLFFLVFIPVAVYKKDFKGICLENVKKGFFYGLSGLVFLPFLKDYFVPIAIVSAFSQSFFLKGVFYLMFENEELFSGITRLNLLSSFLYLFIAVSRSFYSLSYFIVSFVAGILYEKSGSVVAPTLFTFGFFLSKFSILWR